MSFPIKICAICNEEFELKPDKPGFANRCPQCTEKSSNPESTGSTAKGRMTADERKATKEANEARRQAMRNLAGMNNMEVWYARLEMEPLVTARVASGKHHAAKLSDLR